MLATPQVGRGASVSPDLQGSPGSRGQRLPPGRFCQGFSCFQARRVGVRRRLGVAAGSASVGAGSPWVWPFLRHNGGVQTRRNPHPSLAHAPFKQTPMSHPSHLGNPSGRVSARQHEGLLARELRQGAQRHAVRGNAVALPGRQPAGSRLYQDVSSLARHGLTQDAFVWD